MRGLPRFVETLLSGGRPRPFPADDADAEALRVAIDLRAARPGSDAPHEEFITALHRRLARDLAEPAPSTTPARRRLVLGTAVGALAGAVAGVFTGRATSNDPPTANSGELTPDLGIWHPVVAAADLPEGAVHGFTASGIDGFVTRTNGRLRAVSGVCTHQGCRLTPHPEKGLRCPCHGAHFAPDGTVLYHRLKAPIPALPRLALRQRNGTIEVYIPQA
ncbi:Rieske (2Fe-2S) protein [Actinomadura sp. NEAU-AAG7]|uniref:Rieske (2Fe-2S) protein n=1 Tax=Actinomadura sp. NEAU-AAG7 TaxID=2839640 RepID=UPI001BE4B314|nr:Rieske (2Fe-2S) protein [Actinomadura sp. NEAU-AAG7]MBT2206859.1 Rieske (2Fe-2S) protein [Actinomadura sp. NEAU-AAG7]